MIQDSVVVNVCLWDGDTNTWQPPAEYLMEALPEDSLVGIGWSWDGANFVAPVEVPNPALDQPGSPPDVIQ
jgi:hypothetical protein